MIARENNPDYLNSFLDYMVTIQNKSPNTVKEYNYDLATFLKFVKIHFNLTKETEFEKITYNDILTLEDDASLSDTFFAYINAQTMRVLLIYK